MKNTNNHKDTKFYTQEELNLNLSLRVQNLEKQIATITNTIENISAIIKIQ